MVDVAVGQEHLDDTHAALGGGSGDAVEVAAGIDDGGLSGFLAPEQRAILGEGGDGDDVIVHGAHSTDESG